MDLLALPKVLRLDSQMSCLQRLFHCLLSPKYREINHFLGYHEQFVSLSSGSSWLILPFGLNSSLEIPLISSDPQFHPGLNPQSLIKQAIMPHRAPQCEALIRSRV